MFNSLARQYFRICKRKEDLERLCKIKGDEEKMDGAVSWIFSDDSVLTVYRSGSISIDGKLV